MNPYYNDPGSFAPGRMEEEENEELIQERGRDLLAQKMDEMNMDEEEMEYDGWNRQKARSS